MSEVTELLNRWQQGDQSARNELVPLIYDELHHLAVAAMRDELYCQTLQPTAVLHEALMRLFEQNRTRLKSRAHVFSLAARMMRRVLVDHARAKKAVKRGGGKRPLSLENAAEVDAPSLPDPLILDAALTTLASQDPGLCRLAELKLFAGFGMEEIAQILNVAPATVYRHWKLVKAHLYSFFQECPHAQ